VTELHLQSQLPSTLTELYVRDDEDGDNKLSTKQLEDKCETLASTVQHYTDMIVSESI